MDRQQIEERVTAIVSEALDVERGQINSHRSLIDDFDAESIDFLDIRYRLESEFGLSIQDDDLWQGQLLKAGGHLVDPEQGVSPEGLRLLREAMPDFDWSRFPDGISGQDLPRLITLRTIVDYLEPRLI